MTTSTTELQRGKSVPYSTPKAVQIGAVSYLNSKPLIHGLANSEIGQLSLDYPSRLSRSLARGALDVALVPSIEIVRSRGAYSIISDACVAAHGPVYSVKVYFRVPPGKVRSIALDEGSRTSATLARILLQQKYGVEPRPVPFAMGETTEGIDADAILVIGDRAMFPPTHSYADVWDLGAEWNNWTGLPFVFAAWAGREDRITPQIAAELALARDRGVANVSTIVDDESEKLGLSPVLVRDYLTKHLHFKIGPAEKNALRLFAELAAESGLAPSGHPFVYLDSLSCKRESTSNGASHKPHSSAETGSNRSHPR